MGYTFIIFFIGAAERPGFRRFNGLWKKVLRIDRPDGRRVLKFDGAIGTEGCGIALWGDEYYNAAFRRSRPHRVS